MAKFTSIAIAFVASNARADGAFPDEQSIFFFESAPQQIVVGTNFGLMISEDDGKSWLTACEASVSANVVNFYHAGPDADGWIYAATAADLLASNDVACGWMQSAGVFAGQISDVFADQSRAGRVYAIAGTATSASVQRSEDFAATFGPFFSEPSGALTGVEPARSTPTTIYVAGSHATVPYLAQSINDGKTFATWPHPEIKALLRIAAVDPVDAATIYVRVAAGMTDALYVSNDGGKTLADVLDLGDTMSAFLRASNGTLYVGSRSGFLWMRAPNAMSFVKMPAPHFRCLGEHAGAIFACGDSTLDGFAVGRSDDGGKTWAPLVGLQKTGPFLQCPRVQILCTPKAGDAGGGQEAGAAPDATIDASPIVPAPKPSGGCTCGTSSSRSAPFGAIALALLLALRALKPRPG